MATMYSGLGGAAGYGEGSYRDSFDSGNLDDGSVQVDITSVFPDGLTVFGETYTSVYINSNGNLSFDAPNSSYQSADLSAETSKFFAVFLADVNIDTTIGGGGGEIYWDLDPANGAFTVTWKDVQPYSGSGSNSFQIQIKALPEGGYTVERIYEKIEWAGSSGDVADIGITDGGSVDLIDSGSGNETSVLDYENTPGSILQTFGVVDGSAGGDTIDGSYTDTQGESVTGENDVVQAGTGRDTVYGLGGNDTLYGQEGDDTLIGGAGDDTLDGGGPASATDSTETFKWSDVPNTDFSSTFTQDTGTINTTVTFTAEDPDTTFGFTSVGQYTDGGTITNSAGRLTRPNSDGDESGGNSAEVRIDFAASDPDSGHSDAVKDVSFRINDIDAGSWGDTISVSATGPDGQPVQVTLTYGTNAPVTGTNPTITGAGTSDSNLIGGSVKVDIAGPVTSLIIDYGHTGTNGQVADITDITYTVFADPNEDSGDDTLTGGDGNDTFIYSGGNDTITDFNTGNTGTLNDGDATNNDRIDLSAYYDHISELHADQADDGILNQSNTTDTRGNTVDYSDNTAFGDGSLTITGATGDSSSLTFENTNVVCFCAGTRIATPDGERLVQHLKAGDLVLTADHGAQPIRWISSTELSLEDLRKAPNLRPIRIRAKTFGNRRALRVSPQHCMVHEGARDSVFLRARHLAMETDLAVQTDPVRPVRYFHMLFDRHEVIFAEGAPSESFYPGPQALQMMSTATRESLLKALPALKAHPVETAYGLRARRVLKRRDIPARIGTAVGTDQALGAKQKRA